jgi:hypothetical protein
MSMDANGNVRWTDAADHQLLELKAAGKSSRAITDVLKRSGSAIEQRLYILRDRARLEPESKVRARLAAFDGRMILKSE